MEYECIECESCLEVCPTYSVSGELELSPLGRVRVANKVLRGEFAPEAVKSLFSCTLCYACNQVCPKELDLVEIVEQARIALVEKWGIPFSRQREVIASIVERGNALGREPSERLRWLPEPYEERDSERLLFIGCLASYVETGVASASYLLLKKAGVDFRILRDEGCCGIYVYRAGDLKLAKKVFEENAKRFEELGIKEIIVPCLGCYRCFKNYYPRVLGEVGFRVKQITEVIHELMKLGRLRVSPQKAERYTYLDPCYLGRAEGLYDAPREIARMCGAEVVEAELSREKALCCGAGGGVRSLFKDLSFAMAEKALKSTPTEAVLSSCIFCTNQFKMVSRELGLGNRVTHIAELVLRCLR